MLNRSVEVIASKDVNGVVGDFMIPDATGLAVGARIWKKDIEQ